MSGHEAAPAMKMQHSSLPSRCFPAMILAAVALAGMPTSAVAIPQLQMSSARGSPNNGLQALAPANMSDSRGSQMTMEDYGIESSDDDSDEGAGGVATETVPPPPPPSRPPAFVDPRHRADALQRFQILNRRTHKKPRRTASIKTLSLRFSTTLMLFAGAVAPICTRRFQCFPNMMTGNTVKLATYLGAGEYQRMVLPLAMIVAYTAGCGAVGVMERRYPSGRKNKTPLVPIASVAWILFALADLVYQGLGNQFMLPFLAMAYGLVNTAALNAVGVVTNAVTGHYTKLGLGLAEAQLVLNPTAATSRTCLVAFAAAAAASSKVLSLVRPDAPLARIGHGCFGTVLGTVYLVAFAWYASKMNQGEAKQT